MNGLEWLGLLLSFGFVFLMIALSTLLQSLHILGDEGARKLIHIGVAHWWIIAMIFFDDVGWVMIAPIVFIALNYISYKKNIFSAMERSSHGDLGTVYYPISLLLLSIITFSVSDPSPVTFGTITIPMYSYIGALGIFIMGWGDGLAAVVGKKWGKTMIRPRKSLEGTLTMLVVSFVVSYAILSIFTPNFAILGSVILALVATGVEFYTAPGIDNLSVPLITAFVYYLLTLVL